MLTLHLSPGSSSMAPHIALHEIGQPFETRRVSLPGKETRSPAFLALNPAGQVPVLVVEGRALTEVAAILFHLARRFPEAGLWPQGDLAAEAEILSWMSFLAATVHPARRQGAEHAHAIYGVAERRLDGRDWTVGGRYSIADIHLFRLFWRYASSLHPPRSDFPGLYAHHDRMMARPAVRETIRVEAAMGYDLPA